MTEVEESMTFIRKNLMVEYIFTGELQRIERYDYPLEAIREIVTNMIIHRDYRDSGDSIIKIFDNHITFFNPGKLYNDITIEKLHSGHYSSRCRNAAIAKMFKEVGSIEKYGSGIARVKKECQQHGIFEPTFEEFQHGFKVTLHKETTQETTQEIEPKTSTREKICHLIEDNKKITRIELAQTIGVSEDAIKQQLAKLKSEGIIQRVGSTKAGHWEVIK